MLKVIVPLAAPDDQLRVVGHVGDHEGLVPGCLKDFRLLLPGDISRRLADDVTLELEHLAGRDGDVLEVLSLNLWRH